jgi:acyl-CoA synthetase (AMP-forming)/AMP-acid ligase II
MISSTFKFNSLVEAILERVKTDPGQTALIYTADDESEERITIRQLHQRGCAYAGALQKSGIKPGDIVLIALRHSMDLLYAFWGALYTGAVPAVLTYKGPMTPGESYSQRLAQTVRHSGSRAVITLPQLEPGLKKSLPGLSGLNCRILAAGEITAGNDTFSHLRFTSGEAIAYLQYTSGTTGIQKGALLSHRAILNFLRSYANALNVVSSDVVVNWLPFSHDFGLFAGLIMPLTTGIPVVLISPFKWLRNPKIFLWGIHRYKGTISFLPNSAHNHTVRSAPGEGLDGLDLSSLRVLINGSEPILYKSQEIFLKHFAPYGFRETALAAGYGMAENTLGATFSIVGQRSPVDWISVKEMQTSREAVPVPPNTRGAIPYVSSGTPLEGVEVAVIGDSNGNRCRLPERRIGEIIIRSHSLFSGYHNRQDLTHQVMVDGWYHTGDLGYLAGGQLYVCGRKNDLIIVGGTNIHPEELEAIAGSVPGIYPDRTAAFGITDENLGTEKIVMVCELEPSLADTEKLNIESKLRQCVFNELEVTLGSVLLVRKGWMVKTRNGKIARRLNREKYKKFLANQNQQHKKK